MTDSAGEIEKALTGCFAEIFRAGQVTPEDLKVVQVFPTPAFDRLKILWSPIWTDPASGYPEWGDLALLPIRSLTHDIDLKEAALRHAPEKLREFSDDVRDRVRRFLEDLVAAVRNVASHPMFSGQDCLTAFCIARPAPNDDDRTRPELVGFAGARPALGLFPVRNLHDLGPGRKKARRFGWCQYHEDGLTLLLPEGERCTAGIVGRNPTRTFHPFETLTRMAISESELRYSADADEILLVPGHRDPNDAWTEDVNRLAAFLQKQPAFLARLGDRYQDLRRKAQATSLPTVVHDAKPLRTEDWFSARGPESGEYELVNSFAVPSPSTPVAAILDGSFAHLVFLRQGIRTLDVRKSLRAPLERIPYVRKEDDQQVPRHMRRLITNRKLARSIDPHPLGEGGDAPPPFVGHLPLPGTEIFAALRSGAFILLADRDKGLVPVDATDPMKLRGTLPISPKRVASREVYEYVAANERLAVIGSRRRFWLFDLANPARPAEIDLDAASDSGLQQILSAGHDLTDALIHDSTLFVTSTDLGVLAVDVSNPGRLRLQTIHRLGDSRFKATRMQVVEDLLFVFDLAGERCWVIRVGDPKSPLQSLGTLPFAAFAKAWKSRSGAWCFLSRGGEIWTIDLSSKEPAVRSIERCFERWGTDRQPIPNSIDAVPLDDGSILALDDEQLNVLKRQPLPPEGSLPPASKLRLIGGWTPGLTPVAPGAPGPQNPISGQPFKHSIAEKVGASLRKVAQCRPGFRVGSLIVDVKDGRLQLLINPACGHLTALHALRGAVEASWTGGELFSDPAEGDAFRIILSHPELSRPLIQLALEVIATLPRVQELSSGRVRLGSAQWGITRILFHDRRTEVVEDPAPLKVNLIRSALDSWFRSGDEGYLPKVVTAFERDPRVLEDISELATQWESARVIYHRIIATHPVLQSPLLDGFFQKLGEYCSEFDALILDQDKIRARGTQMGEEIIGRSGNPEGRSLKAYAWKQYPLLYDFFRLLERQAEEIQGFMHELEKFFRTLKDIRDAVVEPARKVLETRRIAPGRLGHVFYEQRQRMEKLPPAQQSPLSYPEEYWTLIVKFEELVKSLGPILLDRVSQGDIATVRTLLEIHEVPTYFQDAKGNPLVQVAVASGNPGMVALLCKLKRHIPPDLLEKAILDANEEAVRTIVESGAMFDFFGEGGIDCHALAVGLGHPEVAVFLKEPEPAPEVLAAGGDRPKPYPARLRIAKLLISQSDGKHNELERTGLMTAAVFGSVDVVREILSTMPNLEQKDKTGRTALDWAEKAGHDEVIRLLRGPE